MGGKLLFSEVISEAIHWKPSKCKMRKSCAVFNNYICIWFVVSVSKPEQVSNEWTQASNSAKHPKESSPLYQYTPRHAIQEIPVFLIDDPH